MERSRPILSLRTSFIPKISNVQIRLHYFTTGQGSFLERDIDLIRSVLERGVWLPELLSLLLAAQVQLLRVLGIPNILQLQRRREMLNSEHTYQSLTGS